MKKKTRILVLEDDRTSRKLLAWILEQAGYDVVECSEGRDAIHMAVMHPPAVIIVDVMLPDMRGTEVVEELKKHPACRQMKSIFLTGILTKKAQELDANFCFQVDGQRYRALAKPVRKSVLLRLLRESVAEAEAEQRARSEPATRLARKAATTPAETAEDDHSCKASMAGESLGASPLWEA